MEVKFYSELENLKVLCFGFFKTGYEMIDKNNKMLSTASELSEDSYLYDDFFKRSQFFMSVT